TGDWEWKLGRIEKGEFTRGEFMREIAEMTRHIVERAKTFDSDTIPGDFGVLTAPCPRCGGQIRETYKKFQCGGCDYSLWKIVAGRQFEPAEIDTLITEGQIGPLTGFRNKMGRSFAASIKLNDKMEPEFDFGQDKAEAAEAEPVDFSGQESLGKCPKCAAGVYEHGNAYVCEKSVGPAKTCDFRSGKIILQQPIDTAQMEKLLAEGKTDLLKEFVSNRTRRKFSAYLVAKDGKVGFEFEKKAPVKKPAAKKKVEG
ncbi:MAG TPA: topoisomerase C-terminal repeat-containing protein, partial [Azonexus sp.]